MSTYKSVIRDLEKARARAAIPKSTRAPREQKPADEAGARELQLFIDNDGTLYRQQFTPIVANLMKKRRKGTYDHEKAVKLFGHLAEAGAKKYAKESGGTPWSALFDVPTRKLCARYLCAAFEGEAELGNYDNESFR